MEARLQRILGESTESVGLARVDYSLMLQAISEITPQQAHLLSRSRLDRFLLLASPCKRRIASNAPGIHALVPGSATCER